MQVKLCPSMDKKRSTECRKSVEIMCVVRLSVTCVSTTCWSKSWSRSFRPTVSGCPAWPYTPPVSHTSCLGYYWVLRSNAPVKRYSPVRKNGDHRSIGTHIMIWSIMRVVCWIVDYQLNNTHLHKHSDGLMILKYLTITWSYNLMYIIHETWTFR